MTETSKMNLLADAAGVLADSAHLLAADIRDREKRAELWIDDPESRAFYQTRIRVVQRAHAVAGRVVGALLAGHGPELPDVLATVRHASLFAHWFGRPLTPAGGALHPDDA